MPDNLKQINLLIRDYHLIKSVKKRIEAIKVELREEQIRSKALLAKLKKEHNDIERIEALPLIRIFNIVLKNREEQLEREKQDYLLAVLEHNESVKTVELLEYELGILKNKVHDGTLILKEIQDRLNYVEHKDIPIESYHLREFKTINTGLQHLIELKIEGEEALEAVLELKNNFAVMISYLNKAKDYDNWGEFYKEIQEGKAKKQSYIDKAQAQAYLIKKTLLLLRDELTDVEEYKEAFKASASLIGKFNIAYYQDLIADWINHDNLSQTLSTTMTGSASIAKLERALATMIDNIENARAEMEARRERLITVMAER